MSFGGILGVVLGLAVVDSINPTAIALAAIIMLTRTRWVGGVLSFVLGEGVVYFGVGVAMLFGLSAVGDSIRDYWYSPGAYVIEGVVGAGLVIFSFVASPESRNDRSPEGKGSGALFLLGASVAMVEFVSALPYFAAIGLLIREDLPLGQSLLVLAIYNVVMFLPILLMALGFRFMPGSLSVRMRAFVERNRGKGRNALLWVAGIVGGLLVADAVRFFLVREFV